AARIGISLKGAVIFVTKFPCLACCNSIIQAGIIRIYTHDHKFWDDDPLDPGTDHHARKQKVLKQADIKVAAPYHPVYRPKEQFNSQAGKASGTELRDKLKSRSNGRTNGHRNGRSNGHSRAPKSVAHGNQLRSA